MVGITEAVPAATEAPAEIIEAPAAGIKAEAAAVVAPAAIETTTLGSAPAIELPVIVTIASPPAVADSAEAEAIIETAPAPVLMPKEAIPGDNALRDEEPAQTGSVVTVAAMTRAPVEVAGKYGVMLTDPEGRILDFVEKHVERGNPIAYRDIVRQLQRREPIEKLFVLRLQQRQVRLVIYHFN